MTRRQFLIAGALAPLVATATETPLRLPLHKVQDSRAGLTTAQLRDFSDNIWSEAARDFQHCGIRLEVSEQTGEIRQSPGGRPIFVGLRRGVINVVLTNNIPTDWDSGRALAGVTTMFEGYHICVIALNHAHGHQIPFLSVNTCVHELLHAVLQDVFRPHPEGIKGDGSEYRIDWYATRLWLFQEGSAIRKSAEAYLPRLTSKI